MQTETTKFLPITSASSPQTNFGSSTAMYSTTAVVGSPLSSNGGYVFSFLLDQTTNKWVQAGQWSSPSTSPKDQYGYSVSIYESTLAVGAPYTFAGGAAYLYSIATNGLVSGESKLTPDDLKPGDGFGSSIAVFGGKAAVSSPFATVKGRIYAGAVYVFSVQSNGQWSQSSKLYASDGTVYSSFGTSLAMDKTRLFAGSSPSDKKYTGLVTVLTVQSDGNWAETNRLSASDGKEGDFFGWSMGLSGNTLLVGANGVDSAGADWGGAVYVFEGQSDGSFTETAKWLPPSDVYISAGDYYYFGISVSISGDNAVVGAYGDTRQYEGNYIGAAYWYSRSSSSSWNSTSVVKLAASDGYQYDRFGRSVSVYGDQIIIGADGADNGATDYGAAYSFKI